MTTVKTTLGQQCENQAVAAGAHWAEMNAQPRRRADRLTRVDVPVTPGVYAWYRNGQPVYSGRATGSTGLTGRICGYHLKTGNDLSRSSFRRNVCAHLGIAPPATTKVRPTLMTRDNVGPVNAWIRCCELAWIECRSSDDAKALEKALHAEWLPPLSQR